MKSDTLTTIGRTATLRIVSEDNVHVPAKIDTGADTSSIWASNLKMDDSGTLSFTLFAKESSHYTGKVHTTSNYKVSVVRNSTGSVQVRYKVYLTVVIADRRVRGSFTLSDRSRNTFPVLIGCKLLNKRFIVDVSKGRYKTELKQSAVFQEELKQDPVAFFEKYHAANERGDVPV